MIRPDAAPSRGSIEAGLDSDGVSLIQINGLSKASDRMTVA